jgi:hypothetical protein
MVLPGDTPFKFTLPGEHNPVGLALTVGVAGAVPEVLTVTGVLVEEVHPTMATHEIVIVPSPERAPSE